MELESFYKFDEWLINTIGMCQVNPCTSHPCIRLSSDSLCIDWSEAIQKTFLMPQLGWCFSLAEAELPNDIDHICHLHISIITCLDRSRLSYTCKRHNLPSLVYFNVSIALWQAFDVGCWYSGLITPYHLRIILHSGECKKTSAVAINLATS